MSSSQGIAVTRQCVAGRSFRRISRQVAIFALLLFPTTLILIPPIASDLLRRLALLGFKRPELAAVLPAVLMIATGSFVFRRSQLTGWVFLAIVLLLSCLTTLELKTSWDIWREARSDWLIAEYCLQVTALSLVPLYVAARCQGAFFETSVRHSLTVLCTLNILAVLFQLVVINVAGSELLKGTVLASGHYRVYIDGVPSPNTVRLSGLESNPNVLGMILLLTMPAMICGEFRTCSSSMRQQALPVLGVGLASFCIVLTYSRAAYAGLVVQIAVLIFLSRLRGSWRQVRPYILAIVMGLVIGLGACSESLARVKSVLSASDASITNRLLVFASALEILRERPLVGWGPATFYTLYTRFYMVPGVRYPFQDLHSSVLHTVMQIGVGGVAIGVIALVGVSGRRLARTLPLWVPCAIAGAFIPLCLDNTGFHPPVAVPLLWALAECAYAAHVGGTALANRKRHFVLPGVLGGLWLIGHMQPLPAPHVYLGRVLDQITRRTKGTLDYTVLDFTSNLVLKSSGLVPCIPPPAILGASRLNSMQADTTWHGYNVLVPLEAGGSGTFGRITMDPAASVYLSYRYDISAAIDALRAHVPPAELSIKVSGEQLLKAFCSVADDHTTVGQIIRSACSLRRQGGLSRLLRAEDQEVFYDYSTKSPDMTMAFGYFNSNEAKWAILISSTTNEGEREERAAVAAARLCWVAYLFFRPDVDELTMQKRQHE